MNLKIQWSYGSILLFFSCLVLTSNRAQGSLSTVLRDIGNSLKSFKGDTHLAQKALAFLKTELKSKKTQDRRTSPFLHSVKSGLRKISSKDAKQVIAGCLDLVSGIATKFGGPAGIVVGALASFVSAILGLFTNKAKKSVGEIIDSALKKHYDNVLQGQASGAKRDFAESAAFINALKRQPDITKADLGILAANVPIYKFSQILGTLENRILQGAAATDLSSAKRTIDIILLYSQLVVMRETLLVDLAILYRRPGTADHIAIAVEASNNENRKFAKDALDFLHNLLPEHAIVGAIYHPIENSETSKQILSYLKHFGVPDLPSSFQSSGHLFKNLYWKPWSICVESYLQNYIFRGCPKRLPHYVNVIKLSTGHYTMELSKRTLYITKHEEGWAWGTLSKDPGPQGHMIFIPLKSGNYMISTQQWPDWFLFMESSSHGYIRCWKGNVGPQGVWQIL